MIFHQLSAHEFVILDLNAVDLGGNLVLNDNNFFVILEKDIDVFGLALDFIERLYITPRTSLAKSTTSSGYFLMK